MGAGISRGQSSIWAEPGPWFPRPEVDFWESGREGHEGGASMSFSSLTPGGPEGDAAVTTKTRWHKALTLVRF